MSPIGIRIPANEVDRRWYDELAAAGGSRSDPSADTGNTDVMPAGTRHRNQHVDRSSTRRCNHQGQNPIDGHIEVGKGSRIAEGDMNQIGS